MGDILAGMIAALGAQGLSLEQAAVAGTHLHGAAGDAAVRAGLGPVGLTAGEVARAARVLLNDWLKIPGSSCKNALSGNG
jgi:NAD(P)H-hydrate repair Nnr-like enzyme with NAD(P)H-hydrate dehydratase domain